MTDDGPLVLYIEDNPDSLKLVKRALSSRGYEVEGAEEGFEGLDKARELDPDLILMDINLPGLSGYELTTKLRSHPETEQTPIIALTANVSQGDRERALSAGCNGYISKPIDINELPDQVSEYLDGAEEELPPEEAQQYLQEHQVRVVERLEDKLLELRQKNQQLQSYSEALESTYVEILAAMNRALEAKDPYTAGHSERVTSWAVEIGKKLGLSNGELTTVERSGILHDIGKLIIDLSCIQKEGPLTDDEWQTLAKHPVYSAEIIEPLDFLHDTLEPVRHHHERVDGEGYPDGKELEDLSMLTWVVSCADAIDAMLSRRSYKKAMTFEEVLGELEECSGSQFHPDAAGAAREIIEERGLNGRMEDDIFNNWDRPQPEVDIEVEED